MTKMNQKQNLEDFVKVQNFDRLKAAQLKGTIPANVTDEQLKAFVKYKVARPSSETMKEPIVDQLHDFMVSWNVSHRSKQE
jgi:hypothetical protein